MSLFPRIQSPCPYKDNLAEIMDGAVCRMCKREVHDMTAMTDAERMAFLQSCDGEVCVSYRVVKPVMAAFAVGAMASALPAAAQPEQNTAQSQPAAAAEPYDGSLEIVVGGLRKPRSATWEFHTPAPKMPPLPVSYEDAPARQPEKKSGA